MDQLKELYEQRKQEQEQFKISEGIFNNKLKETEEKTVQLMGKLASSIESIQNVSLKQDISDMISRHNKQGGYTLQELEVLQHELGKIAVRISDELRGVLGG